MTAVPAEMLLQFWKKNPMDSRVIEVIRAIGSSKM